MAFETYLRQRPQTGDEPSLTIQRRGVFSFNRATYAALGEPEAVELLYDRDERLIALRKVDPKAESAYVVRPVGRGGTWLVSGKAFMQYYQLETFGARRRTARLEGDLLIVDLKEPGIEVVGNRTKPTTPGAAEDSPGDADPLRMREAFDVRPEDGAGDGVHRSIPPPQSLL